MTNGKTFTVTEQLNSEEDFDALQEVTADLEQAEALIEELEGKLSKSEALLAKAVEAERVYCANVVKHFYERERDRFKHATPEISGAYFLTGGHGPTDDNMLPQYIEICPAYGCAWVQVYERSHKTISYEGS